MYFFMKIYSTFLILVGYATRLNTLMKPIIIHKLVLIQAKLFFYWEVTNSFLVVTGAVNNNYNPWWQQTKQVIVLTNNNYKSFKFKKTRK